MAVALCLARSACAQTLPGQQGPGAASAVDTLAGQRVHQRDTVLAAGAVSTLMPLAQLTSLAADTAVYWQGRNVRVGFNTFLFSNQFVVQERGARRRLRATVGQAALFTKNIGRTGKFVQQDVLGGVRQTFSVGRQGVYIGHQGRGALFAANGNRLAEYGALAGVARPITRGAWQAEAWAGLATDKRGDIQNGGGAAAANARLGRISADSTLQTAYLLGITQTAITPRYNAAWQAQATVSKQFGGGGFARATAGYLRRRVEDYYLPSIQSTRSDSLQLGVTLGTQLGKRFSLSSDNQLLLPNRAFVYRAYTEGAPPKQNTFYKQTEVATRHQAVYASGRIKQTAILEIGERTRTYGLTNSLSLDNANYDRAVVSEQTKNISEYTVAWLFGTALQLSKRADLAINTVSRLFRVNTPSELNDQDRDEALYAADALWTQRWFAGFRTGIRVSGSLKEIVFIKATQSAQNFTERIVRLEPVASYQTGPLTLTSSCAVWATYNVRTYGAEQAKNRSNRIFIIAENVKYQLSANTVAYLDVQRRENRIAQLDWGRFAESPIDTVVVTELHPRLGHIFSLGKGGNRPTLSAQAGYKLYRQVRHNVAGVSEPGVAVRQASVTTITQQHGPSVALALNVGRRGQIGADAWVQWARTGYRFRESADPFVGQTYPISQLRGQEQHVYLFFTLAGTLLF